MFIYCTNKEKFYKYINKETIVLFTANWCGACIVFKPIFEEYIKINKEKLFLFIEVEQDNEIAKEQRIISIPTVRYYKNNKIKKELEIFTKEGLEKFGKIK